MANGQSFLDKFAEVSAKVGNQVHLRSLRDGFATIMPIFILAGIAALLNNVVFTFLWSADPSSPGLFPNADVLATAQYWGNSLTQGALSITGLPLLKQQFERVNQVVGFNRQTIKAFARTCSLQYQLAIDHLFPANEKRGTGNMAKVTAACAIGEGLTTLIDMAYLDNVTVESVFPQIGVLQLNYRIIQNSDEEILRRLQFWANFCRTKSMSAVLSAEEKSRLKEDAEFMRKMTK